MKSLATVIGLLLLSFTVCAQTAYFCTEAGTILHYVRTNVDDGSLKWTHLMEIHESQLMADSSRQVIYSSTITTGRGRKLTGETPVLLEAVISPEGEVSLNPARSMAAMIAAMLPRGTKVGAEGSLTSLPADLSPGDTLPPAAGKVRALGMVMNVRVDRREVLRLDTLQTPAGTFPCVVVSEHKIEKGMMRNRETTALTWYCRGLGMIRHDTYDKKLRIETSEVLVSIERKNYPGEMQH